MSDNSSLSGQSKESVLHVQDYLMMLRNRWKEAILVFLLVFISCAVLTRMMTPMYTTSMRFEIKMPRNLIDVHGGVNPIITEAASSSSYMQTQFELLVTEENLKAVANRLGLPKEWNVSAKVAAGRLKGMIMVQPMRSTDLIDVVVTGSDARLVQRVCEAVPLAYKEVREAKEENLINRTIEARFALIRARHDELERKADVVRQYIRSGKYVDSAIWSKGSGGGMLTDGDSTESRMRALQSQKNALEAEISTSEVHISELQKLGDEELLGYVRRTGILSAESYSSSRVRALSEQYNSEIETRKRMIMEGIGENHPKIQLLDAQHKTTQDELYAELIGMRDAMMNQLNMKKAELAGVDKELAIEKEKLRGLLLENQKTMRALQEYNAEKQRYDQLENDYIADRIRLTAPRDTIVIHSEPPLPGAPSSPNYKLNLTIGAVVGLIAGIVVAFIYNYFDTSIKTLEEAERQLGLPVMGVIPQDAGLFLVQGGNSPDAEAYRILRTNIELKKSLFKSSVYAVVSSNAGEGKTTTLSNLAYVCAQSGYSTLMIDGDLRRPRLASYSEIANDRGLTNYLSEDTELKDVIFKTELPNLYILPSGPKTNDPSGMLASYRMDRLLQEAARRFDIVLVDSPPMLGVSDASLIVSKVDATLIVLQPRKMPVKALQRSKALIEDAGGKIMGLVLNNVDITGDSQYQYYTTYYSYYTNDNKRPEPQPIVKKAQQSAAAPTPSSSSTSSKLAALSSKPAPSSQSSTQSAAPQDDDQDLY